MTNLYTDEDLRLASKQRNRLLSVYIAICVAYVVFLAAMLGYYISLPYQDEAGIWVQVVTCAVTVLFIFFSFPYMGICFKRCNAYYRMMKFISVGLKEGTVLPFEEVDDWTVWDGVDVNVANFTVYDKVKKEKVVRHIYVDGEKDFPPFQAGDLIKIVSQGNLLIAYEIVEKGGGAFSEFDPGQTEEVTDKVTETGSCERSDEERSGELE